MAFSFINESFETPDTGQPGGAAGWTMSSSVASQQIAAFGPGPIERGWEGYETGWLNDPFLTEFTQTDVEAAIFCGPPWLLKPYEDFECGWGNLPFYYDLTLLEEAGFTHGGAPGPNGETFEGGWLGNESYVYTFGDPAMDITDDFESGWRNDDYLWDLTPPYRESYEVGAGWTSGSGLTEQFEGFEAVYAYARAFPQHAIDAFAVAGGHNLEADEPVFMRNDDGALPTGLQEGRRYYARIVSPTVFELAYVAGGSRIDFTDDGYGEHYVYADPDWFWNTEVVF